jgi:hypothetical protein
MATDATTSKLMQDIKSDADRLVSSGSDPISAQTYLDTLQSVANAHVGRVESGASSNTVDYLSILKTTLSDKVNNYNQNSQRLVDYSDMYATNNYVQQELRSETERVKALVTKMRSKIHTSKANSQEYIYQTNRYNYMTFVVLLTAMTVLLAFSVVRANLAGYFSDAGMFTILLVMGVIYIGTMTYSLIKNSYRTRLDWTKFYFDKHQEKEKCKI